MKNFSFGILKRVSSSFILSACLVQAASAGIIITKVDDRSDTSAVSFLNPGSVLGPSTTVTGTVGPVRNRYLVDFTSNEMLQAFHAPASTGTPIAAQVRAIDGGINRLGVSVRDGAFTSLYLNFRKGSETGNPSRFGEITVTAFDGEVANFDFGLFNGNNFLRVDATDGTLLRDLLFTTPFNNIVDVRGVRVGGFQDAPVPEPATLLSFGIGMVGMMAMRRRARPKDAAVK